MKTIILLTLSIFLIGCASVKNEASVGVNEILHNKEKYEGKTITVSGWRISGMGSNTPFAISDEQDEKYNDKMLLVNPEQRRDPYSKEIRTYGSITGKLVEIELNGTTIHALINEG